MKERKLLQEISRIASASRSLSSALSGIESLLASEWGGALLTIRAGSQFPAAAGEFLESRSFPFRGLYFAAVPTGGTLVACVGTWGEPGEILPRVTRFIANRLAQFAPSVEAA